MFYRSGAFIPAYVTLRPVDLLRAHETGPWPDYFPFSSRTGLWTFSGRVALFAGLQRLKLPPRSTVLFPSYFQGSEIDTVLAAGLRLRFYRLTPGFGVDLDDVEARLDGDVSALYVIHYFGLPQRLDPIAALCRRKGIALIEDCALSLFSRDDGVWLGSRGDMALFSVYKSLPLPHGGFLVTQDDAPDPPLERPPKLSTLFQTVDLAAQHVKAQAPGRTMVERVWAASRSMRKALARSTVVSGTTTWDPQVLGFRASPVVPSLMRGTKPEEVIRRRRDNFSLLRSLLADSKAPVVDALPPGGCPLFFPLRVNERAEFRRALSARGIGSVSLWSTDHPSCPEPFRTDVAAWRREIVEVPIHHQLDTEHILRIGTALGDLLRDRRYRAVS